MKLLDNGLDSLKKAVKELKSIPGIQDPDEKESAMKDVIIHLHHSIETLFKYIIQDVNPYLVFVDVEGAFNRQFDNLVKNKPAKDENTIEFLDAVHRVFVLKNAEKDVEIDQQRYGLFDSLNCVRNALTHFEHEFDYDYEEHKIAGILQTLVPLYKACLPNFDTFARNYGLYEDVQDLKNNGFYWQTQRSAAIYLKIKNALAQKASLDSKPEEFQKLFNAKNKNLIYSMCLVCGKVLFVKSSNYIIDSEHIHELGKCDCCGFVYTREDAQLVAYKYSSLPELKNKLDGETLAHLVERQLMDLENSAYRCTADELGAIQFELYRSLLIITDNLCEHVARQYVDREITQYNDRAEAIYEFKDITEFGDEEESEPEENDEPADAVEVSADGGESMDELFDDDVTPFSDDYGGVSVERRSRETRHQWINLAEEIKTHGFPTDGEYYWRLEQLLLDYINEIDTSISKHIKTKLSKADYLVYCDSMFMNWDGHEVSYDVPVTVDFKSSEFNKLKLPTEN